MVGSRLPRHQLEVYQRTARRPRLRPADLLLWAWLACAWSGWRDALVIVQPRTVIAWLRKRFREHWTRLTRQNTPGRPRIAKELRALIRRMSTANPSWGSPRIVGELQKLALAVAKATVERYVVRPRKPPSPTWRAFLATHAKDLVSIDFFTVAAVRFEILFVLIILAHDVDCPESRPLQSREEGAVVEVAEPGGLYRHYERWAA